MMAYADTTDTSLVHKVDTTAEEMSCGFCLQKLIYMEDPRILPCHHVFCLPCLQGDFAKFNFVQCGICGKNHGKLDMDKLPTVKAESSGNQIEETIRSGVPSCDVCTENPSPTDKYCRDCGVKLCAEHFKIHEAMLRGSHEILSLQKYLKIGAQDLTRETCETHQGKYLQLACKSCHQIFCQYCDMQQSCMKTNSNDLNVLIMNHVIQSLDTLAEGNRNTIENLLKSLSEKISGMGQTEKQCWKVLDDVEDKVKITLAEVDRITAVQIEKVKRKSEELKREIEDYLTESTERIEKHISDLVEQREQLDSTWSALINKLNHYSDTEFLRSYQTALNDLKATEEIDVSVFKPDDIELSPLDHDEPLDIHITRTSSCWKPPQTIVGPTHTMQVKSSSVCWKQDGTLISSGDGNITLFSQTIQKSKSATVMFGDCIREFGDGYLVMSGTAVPTGTVKLHSSALKETATLTASSHTNYDHLSATDTAIVTVEGGNHQLAVYNAATLKLEYIIKLVDYKKPRGVFIYNKDSVLVSDNDGNKISLYELKKDGKLLWTCDGLESPTGISVDDDGLIYVACNNKLVIISRKGNILTTLTHDQIKNDIYDISIRGDKMALACYDKGILIFDIQR